MRKPRVDGQLPFHLEELSMKETWEGRRSGREGVDREGMKHATKYTKTQYGTFQIQRQTKGEKTVGWLIVPPQGQGFNFDSCRPRPTSWRTLTEAKAMVRAALEARERVARG